MKSSFKNMTLVMLGIALVCSATVAGVYLLTKERIAQVEGDKRSEAIGEVLPEFDKLDKSSIEIGGEKLDVNVASKGGQTVGYAVECSANGFGGPVVLMVGFDTEGVVTGIKVLSHAETPGLGSLITEEDNVLVGSILGKNPSTMTFSVSKDGGDIDALTGATITSRAYVATVEKAFNAYLQQTTGKTSEGYTGATKQAAEQQKGENNE
jgi:electron transport complex protein RnfG